MYNVLIVEDELLVRTGIAASVDWSQYNMNISALVSDGLAAYNAFTENHIDIVITDIKMPKFDGLSLIRKIRELDQKCKIIVFTCMEDFNTLHEAFNLGISGYLLKATMKSEDLEALLDKVKNELDDVSETNRIAYNPKNDLNIIKDYIHGEYYDDGSIASRLAGIIGIELKSADDDPTQIRQAFSAFYDRLAAFGDIFVMEDGNTLYYVLLKPSVYDNVNGYSLFYELRDYVKGVFDVDSTLVAYVNDVKPTSFTKIYASIKHLLHDNYFIVSEFSYLDDEQKVICQAIDSKFKLLRENQSFFAYRIGAFKNKYMNLIDQLESQFCVNRRRFENTLSELARHVFSEKGISANEDNVSEFCLKLSTYSTAREALDAYIALYPASEVHSLYSHDIVASTTYMQEHISENITLPYMASMISISPNYYASLFKQIVGVNFSEYLGKIRLDCACDLLMNTNKSVQEISQLCGFSDVTYFTRYFKANLGQPPKRWRIHNEA